MGSITTIIPFELFAVLCLAQVGICIVAFAAILQAREKKNIQAPPVYVIVLAYTIVTLGMCIIFVRSLLGVPKILHTDPASNGLLDTKYPTITLLFSTPVDFRLLKVHTFPEQNITLLPHGYMNNALPFGRTLTVKGTMTIPHGEHIKVYVANIKGPLSWGYGSEQLLEVQAPDPEIASIHPPEATREMLPMQSFTVKLSQESGKESEWNVVSTPFALLSVQQTDPTTLQINPRIPLQQATAYTWTFTETPLIKKIDTGELIEKLPPREKSVIHFTTVRPPFIASFWPQGRTVRPDAEIAIQFTQPMNTLSVRDHITISPSLTTTLTWDASQSAVRITHPQLEKDTTYIVTLGKGITNARGGQSNATSSFQFHTVGPLAVNKSMPENDTKGVSIRSPIMIEFDQEIPSSVAPSITVIPNIRGKREVNGNTVFITPDTQFAFDTRYTVTVPAKTASTYGFPSTSDQVFSFVTQPNETALAVPFFEQQSAFTCNIAAARMLLAYRGVTVSEATLINTIGSGGKRNSGDPNKGYIDDYGTYWNPVSRGVMAFRPNRLITSGKLSDIINELARGNPVMTWGQNGWSDPHDISWTTPDGTRIYAINGMHSTVVRGFRGPKEEPTAILLNDPWRGQYDIPTQEFLRRWGFLGIAMVVD